MDWLIVFFALALMIVGPGLLILAWVKWQSVPSAILAAAATVVGGVWWVELYRFVTGAGDLDGTFDCYPNCSVSQKTAGAVLFYVPVAIGALLVGLLLVKMVSVLRRNTVRDVREA